MITKRPHEPVKKVFPRVEEPTGDDDGVGVHQVDKP
jgi:hypothetical protein